MSLFTVETPPELEDELRLIEALDPANLRLAAEGIGFDRESIERYNALLEHEKTAQLNRTEREELHDIFVRFDRYVLLKAYAMELLRRREQ